MLKIKKLVGRYWPMLRKFWDISVYWLTLIGSIASILSLLRG